MTQKSEWVEQEYISRLHPEEAALFLTLPENFQRSLAAAALGIYNRGFQHGRSFSSSGEQPVYYVPEPALKSIEQSTDIA